MKKLTILLLMVLGFTITISHASYVQPTNEYTHTFTSDEEEHIISDPIEFREEKLATADVYLGTTLVVDSGTAVSSNYLWSNGNGRYTLFTNGPTYETTLLVAYDSTSYNGVTYYGGAMIYIDNTDFSLPQEVTVIVEASQPIRPKVTLDSVIGNKFIVEVQNYNDYYVTFVPKIFDSLDNELESNRAYTLEPLETQMIEIDFLDFMTEEYLEYDSTYTFKGYFTKLFDNIRFIPSEYSDTITVNTGPETTYNVTLNYNSIRGTATGPSSSVPREMLTFTATANSGYRFSGWQVNSDGVTDTFDDDTLYYEMPYNDITVTAIFTEVRVESGYRNFTFEIDSSNERYASYDTSFWTRGRLGDAKIYIDGTLVVNNGDIVNDSVWLQYYNNPYMDNVFELQELGTGGLMTFSYGDGTNFDTDTQQGDVWLWIDSGETTTPFVLEVLLPEIDPNPGLAEPGEIEENVPTNIQAALDLFGANNGTGYILIFVSSILLVNIGLIKIGSNAIGYVIVNFMTATVYIAAGMLPLWAAIIFIGFILLAFIATIKGGTVSE